VADSEAAGRAGLPAEISSSLAIVWKRFSGSRPADVATVVDGTRVACVMRDSVGEFNRAIADGEADEDGPPRPVTTVSRYEREAIEAVAKATRRRVLAFVSDHDAKSDAAKEVFILDRPPVGGRRSPLAAEGRSETA